MFIQTNCPHCRKATYRDVVVKFMEFKLTFNNGSQMLSYLINNMEVDGTVNEEKIAHLVLQELSETTIKNITVLKLHKKPTKK